MFNKQQAIGHLAADVEVKPISDDRAVLKFRVGASHRFSTKDGIQEHTEWFNVVCFCTKKAAESYYIKRLVKGALVFFEGRTVTSEYAKRDGSKGYRTEVECAPHDVVILPGKSASSQDDQATGTSSTDHRPTIASNHTDRTDLLNFD